MTNPTIMGTLILPLILGLVERCVFAEESAVDVVTLGVIVGETSKVRDGKTFDFPKRNGMCIAGVFPYSSATQAKLNPYDVIVAIDGEKVETFAEWNAARKGIASGDKVRLEVLPVKGNNKKLSWGSVKRITMIAKSSGEDALSAIRRDHDPVAGETWVFHKDSPQSAQEGNDLSLYFNEKAGVARDLTLRLIYTADNWLFVESMLLAADSDRRQEFDLKPASWKRKNNSAGIWEWCDVPVTKKMQVALNSVILRPTVTLRYEGATSHHDRELTGLERARMWTVMTAFTASGGTLKD